MPPNYNTLLNYCKVAASAVKTVHGQSFVTGSAGREIGLGAGGTDDAMYSLGVAASFTVEVRGNSFIEKPSQIKPSGQEVFAGFIALATKLLQQEQ